MTIDPDMRERLLADLALGALDDDCSRLVRTVFAADPVVAADDALIGIARAALQQEPTATPLWRRRRRDQLRVPTAIVAAAAAGLVTGLLVHRPARVVASVAVVAAPAQFAAVAAPADAGFWSIASVGAAPHVSVMPARWTTPTTVEVTR